jgi:hypothetical protein
MLARQELRSAARLVVRPVALSDWNLIEQPATMRRSVAQRMLR